MERVYKFEKKIVKPGEVVYVNLEMVFSTPVPGTGIPGFPETRRMTMSNTEKPFKPHHINVNPECIPYFKIPGGLSCFVGNKHQWEIGAQGMSCEILNKRPAIDFSVVQNGLSMLLQVQNISTTSREFSACVVGEDVEEEKDTQPEAQDRPRLEV